MPMRPSRAIYAILMLVLGCQEPPDVSGDIEDYANLLHDTSAELCVCYQSLGYDSLSECDDAMGFVTLGERDCLARVVEGHEDAAKEHLECVNSALTLYLQCLGANVDCDDSAGAECTQMYEVAEAACPQLPSEIKPEFDACTA